MKDPIKNIYQKINEVMKEVSYIQKGQLKKVAGQYTYISHDQVTAALHEPLTRHGIAVIPTVLEIQQNGNMCIAKVQVSFVNIDNPTDCVSVVYVGHGIDSGDKGPGKSISYACKYALLKTFCLETGDDPDHDQDVVHKETHPANANKKVETQVKLTVMSDDDIANFYDKHKKDKDDLKSYVAAVSKTRSMPERDVVCMIANDPSKLQSFNDWKKVQRQ